MLEVQMAAGSANVLPAVVLKLLNEITVLKRHRFSDEQRKLKKLF
jgi:hypothetical protein